MQPSQSFFFVFAFILFSDKKKHKMGNLRAAKKDAIRALNAKRQERAAARKAVRETKKTTKKANRVENKGEQLRKGVVSGGHIRGVESK